MYVFIHHFNHLHKCSHPPTSSDPATLAMEHIDLVSLACQGFCSAPLLQIWRIHHFQIIIPNLCHCRTTCPPSRTSFSPANPPRAFMSTTLRSRTCPSRWWMWAGSARSDGAGLNALTQSPPSSSSFRLPNTTRWFSSSSHLPSSTNSLKHLRVLISATRKNLNRSVDACTTEGFFLPAQQQLERLSLPTVTFHRIPSHHCVSCNFFC